MSSQGLEELFHVSRTSLSPFKNIIDEISSSWSPFSVRTVLLLSVRVPGPVSRVVFLQEMVFFTNIASAMSRKN